MKMRNAILFILIMWIMMIIAMVIILPPTSRASQVWGSEFCAGYDHGFTDMWANLADGEGDMPRPKSECPVQPPRPLTADTDYLHGYAIGTQDAWVKYHNIYRRQ